MLRFGWRLYFSRQAPARTCDGHGKGPHRTSALTEHHTVKVRWPGHDADSTSTNQVEQDLSGGGKAQLSQQSIPTSSIAATNAILCIITDRLHPSEWVSIEIIQASPVFSAVAGSFGANPFRAIGQRITRAVTEKL